MGRSKFQRGIKPRLLSHLECYMSLPRELKDVQIRMTRIIWDLGKKNLIWRKIEKISGVYSGRELNKKGCDKSLCCQGCGKQKRGNGEKEPRRCERAWACGQRCCRARSGRHQAGWRESRGHREGARNPAKAEDVPWAPKGRDTSWLPKLPALTLCAIRNSEKEAGSAIFFHVFQHKA